MGFIVKKPVDVLEGASIDEFYVRIENGILNKEASTILIVLSHYDTAENASRYISTYIEDDATANPIGVLPVSMSIQGTDEWNTYPMHYEFNITSSELVTEATYTELITTESVEYIDFDEYGTEFIATRDEYYSTMITGSREVIKSKRTINLMTGSLYEYGYEKLKSVYGELFGSENIIDLI